jgi:hypothetical protein
MTAEQCIRFLAHEAEWCRCRDSAEMLCLLLPAMLRALDLRSMNGYEAESFRADFRLILDSDFRFTLPSRLGR